MMKDLMTLYAFDSCPYCLRVRAMLALKELECQIVFLKAGIFPEYLKAQLPSPTVPILEIKDKASNKLSLIQESRDIMQRLDMQNNQRLFDSYMPPLHLQEMLKELSPSIDMICYPRMPYLDLPELASLQSQYFFKQFSQEKLGMSHAAALRNSDKHVAKMEKKLISIEKYIGLDSFLGDKERVSMNDIYLFSELRNLTMVKELKLPKKLSQFLSRASEVFAISLYRNEPIIRGLI